MNKFISWLIWVVISIALVGVLIYLLIEKKITYNLFSDIEISFSWWVIQTNQK